MLLVTAVLVLAGCGSGPAAKAPVTTEQPAIRVSALVGDWRVTVPGPPGGPMLRLTAAGLLLRGSCDLGGGWVALPSGQFTNFIDSGSGCRGDELSEPPGWLRAAARMRAAGDGWEVLDAGGTKLATLDPATMPKSDTNLVANEPVSLTAAERDRLDRVPPPLPSGVAPVTAAGLAGRWSPTPTAKPFAEFRPDGTYAGSDGCNDLASRWVTDGAGRVAVTGGISTLIGCENLNLADWFTGARISRQGDALVFYDAAGREAHRLVRR